MPEFKRKDLRGVFPLLPLPIKAKEEIDYDAIEWNVDWLEQNETGVLVTKTKI